VIKFNLDFWTDSDLSVCWIAPKMKWIHSLVSVNRLAQFHEKWLATESMQTVNKSPKMPRNSAMLRKWKSDLESVSKTRSQLQVKRLFPMVGAIASSNFSQIG